MKRKFAVFDIDGTLIRWQLYHAVVDKLAKHGHLGENGHQKLHEARMRWKRREDSEGFRAYELELIKLYEAAITTIDLTKFDSYVDEVIEEYKDQAYTYTRDLIKQLREKNYVLLAISGSQEELVARIAKYYQFDDYIGTHYERNARGFTGKAEIASHDKKSRLTSLVKKHNLTFDDSIAVGDSGSDGVMLEMVERPIAFNPDRTLFNLAKQAGWKVVVERKNMVYELENKSGQYVLV